MYYLIVTQGLESILFKVPLFEFEVLSVSIETSTLVELQVADKIT